jgi:hypothetical protein
MDDETVELGYYAMQDAMLDDSDPGTSFPAVNT